MKNNQCKTCVARCQKLFIHLIHLTLFISHFTSFISHLPFLLDNFLLQIQKICGTTEVSESSWWPWLYPTTSKSLVRFARNSHRWIRIRRALAGFKIKMATSFANTHGQIDAARDFMLTFCNFKRSIQISLLAHRNERLGASLPFFLTILTINL